MERRHLISVLVLLVLVCHGWLPGVGAQEVPFTGVVVEDSVEARAGAGRAFYVVGQLNTDDVVEVEEVIFGWHRIAAPQGVRSYVSKAFVNATGDGKTGTVNADRTDVKAASINGPGESYRVQVVLNQGDEVKITDETGSFYEILPPAGASVFLPPGSIRRAEAMEDEPQLPLEVALDEPAVERAPEPLMDETPPTPVAEPTVMADSTETITITGDTSDPIEATEPSPLDTKVTPADAPRTAPAPPPAAPIEPTETAVAADDAVKGIDDLPEDQVDSAIWRADSPKLLAVEREMGPMFLLPLEQQDIARMTEAYERLQGDASLSLSDQQVVYQRLEALAYNAEVKRAVLAVASVRAASQRRVIEVEPRADAGQPVSYDAVGRLLASGVYDGQTLPRMFRLVNAKHYGTIAYVRPGQSIDERAMLGQVVGIVGDRAYDPATKLNVIAVERIDVLASPR